MPVVASFPFPGAFLSDDGPAAAGIGADQSNLQQPQNSRRILPAPDRITIFTAPKPSSSACPLCGVVSSWMHSHYTRTLADLPWQGRVVTVQVRARRFRCATAGCLRQVFAERLPGVAQSWARRTARLGDLQRHIGFALGGEPGSRLSAAIDPRSALSSRRQPPPALARR